MNRPAVVDDGRLILYGAAIAASVRVEIPADLAGMLDGAAPRAWLERAAVCGAFAAPTSGDWEGCPGAGNWACSPAVRMWRADSVRSSRAIFAP